MIHSLPSQRLDRTTRFSLFLLSSATLAYEINLTRLFSVAQFYHFAFMIVSIALLGFGASGALLAIFPRLYQIEPKRILSGCCLGASMGMLGSYLFTNGLPFDSFSIAWDRRQIAILILHYLALTTPFVFSGLAVGALLSSKPDQSGNTYAVNLGGSALGCILALAAPSLLGGEGTVILCCGLSALGACLCLITSRKIPRGKSLMRWIMPMILLSLVGLDLGIRLSGNPSFPWLEIRISPYKSLSYALQYPEARITFQRWNAFSRVDRVHSAGIRSLPGLSFRYLEALPRQDGLFIDGDELNPVVHAGVQSGFHEFMPNALAYELRPEAEALILGASGGLDVFIALASGAAQVTAVEINPLVVAAAGEIYSDQRVSTVIEAQRSYLRRSVGKFDVIVLALTNSFHPIRSGAYSLSEDYRYTVESFQDALAHLGPGGLLVVNRWLQTPPSESLRLFAILVTALENMGADPIQQIVAYRGYNLATLVAKNGVFTHDELETLRQFSAQRAFDLVYAPDINPDEVNRYSILEEEVYFQTYTALLASDQREIFYTNYDFEIRPSTDDHPFFGHFFKWSQAGQVLAELGKTWQPFGGAGYFVILVLLVITTFLAVMLVIMPVAISHWRYTKNAPVMEDPDGGTLIKTSPKVHQERGRLAYLLYFGALGLAFLLVEIPLIQQFILYLGHPAYALTMVLFTLLLFSGLGSQYGGRIPLALVLGLLVVLILVSPWLLPVVFRCTLGLPLIGRLALTVALLAPFGFLMGIPFPAGIQRMGFREKTSGLIPWVWAINGGASVVASVLAALLALSFGFRVVLYLGAACYVSAWLAQLMAWGQGTFRPAVSPDR